VHTDPLDRVRHARGQSLPDWIALRSGALDAFPDGVAYPRTERDVHDLLGYARSSGASIIPYGGGTSVAGHVNPMLGDAPVLTVDISRMQRLRHLSKVNRLATFEAGVSGPVLEAQLRAQGYTLGHFPQSFEFSTLGGWVATRSAGQQSLGYGRIEHLFAGGRLEAPAGNMVLRSFPASAAGPDLRALVLGSEGRLGIITEATVRIARLPEREEFHAVFFRDWHSGLSTARTLAQLGVRLSMLRLSTTAETTTLLTLGGHSAQVRLLEFFLRARGLGAERCMMLLGFTGRRSSVEASIHEALRIARHQGGVHLGQALGRQWQKSRFRVPYLRNALWDSGYAVDTVETAVEWDRAPGLVTAIEEALRGGLQGEEERVHVTTHLSHVYPSGSSIYTTFIFRIAADPDTTLGRWRTLKSAASEAIVRLGGTISHQHGVGTDHLPYLQAEKATLGLGALRALCAQFDPEGLMNPGKLVP
jgi:alkyldihydroxyacetonephosphate synthase